MKYIHALKEFAIITAGTAIVATAVFFFMLPSHVSVGSGAALAMVLSNFIPMSVSTITLIMNVGLLIIGFILIGPEFGVKTIYCSILMPLIMGLFEALFPNFQSITQDPLLDVLCYILVVGVGLSILFPRNASSGGLDIVAKIMNKYLKMDLGQAMSTSGIVVALSSALCYCSRDRVTSALISLGRKELEEIKADGKAFPVECQFCDEVYEFTPDDIEQLLKEI